MPRIVPPDIQQIAIEMMLEKDSSGSYLYGQREIERQTGLSRPFIRKLANEIGHQFPRNGIEIVGKIAMCLNCGGFFRRPPSKIDRAKRNFCCTVCQNEYIRGSEASMWKGGESAKTFSKWIQGQADYKRFREEVLERDGYRCVFTGETDEIDVHHLSMKSTDPKEACNPKNGITVSKTAHRRIHELMRNGKDFEECVEILKKEFKKE